MCIKLVQWFICPVPSDETTGLKATVRSEVRDAPEKPWEHLKYNQPLSLVDLALYDPPPYKGFTYVWHKGESWIRCAIVRGRLCQSAPRETRTEIFNIQCADCVGEDPSVRRSRPLHIYHGGHAEATGDDLAKLEQAVAGYFDELLKLLQAWFDRLLKKPLPSLAEASHNVLFGSLCCVQEPDRHIFLPENAGHHPFGTHLYECCRDCNCTRRPWAQNISRGGRWQEAWNVRSQEPVEWFTHSLEMVRRQDLDDIKHSIGNPSPLVDLFIDRVHSIDLMDRINDRIRLLTSLGPMETDSEPEAISPAQWLDMLRARGWLAKQLAFYPSHDPGLSAKFCELLLDKHILTVLNPWRKQQDAPAGWFALDWGRPAQQNVCDMMRAWFTEEKHFTPLIIKAFELTETRRDQQFVVMDRNRQIARQNLLQLYDGVERRIAAREITPALAKESSEHCQMCQEEWQEYPEPPTAYRIASTHCCKKPIHVKCFKRWVCCRTNALCPYCNEDLSRIARLVLSRSQNYEDVPTGLFNLRVGEIPRLLMEGNDAPGILESLAPSATMVFEDGTAEPRWFVNPNRYRRIREALAEIFWIGVAGQLTREELGWVNELYPAVTENDDEPAREEQND